MAALSRYSSHVALDVNGDPLVGAKLHTYIAGTTTPKATYTDSELTIAATNPLISDGNGRFAAHFVDTGRYKFVLTDADDALIWTVDGVSGSELLGLQLPTGVASADQALFAAAATAGSRVTLRANSTYYMTAGLTPATGFGLHFEPGAKIVLVTKPSGSGDAGFKNYSGLAASRNSVAGTAFMCTVDGGSYYFTGDVRFEGDNVNQPILRPIYAANCYLYADSITIRNLNACAGALSLDGMRGGYVKRLDVRGNASMVDSAYTGIVNYSPAGLLFDDDQVNRSSRMVFGDVLVADLNRDPSGDDPAESDAVTVGGIDKAVRSGTEEGHVFSAIRAENVGEAFDCMQRYCYVGSLIGKDLLSSGAKFIHGAQHNTIAHIDIDGFVNGGIEFAGSNASTQACDGNMVLGGRVAGASASNPDSAPIRFMDNGAGTASVPKRNLVVNVDIYGESTSDYVIRSNLDATSAGAIAAGEDNRVISCPNLGDAPAEAYALNAEGGVFWDEASELGLTAAVKANRDNPTITSGARFYDDATNLVISYDQDVPYATSGDADDPVAITTYRIRDSDEALAGMLQEIVRGEVRTAGAQKGRKVYRLYEGASTRDYEYRYDAFYVPNGAVIKHNGLQVVGAQQAAIADAPTGGNATTINAILAALRAHGLIAT